MRSAIGVLAIVLHGCADPESSPAAAGSTGESGEASTESVID